MKMYQKRSLVMRMANALKRQGWSFSSAQKHCWKVVRCICEMKKDEVVLRFCKEGEEIPEQRTATLSPAFFSYTTSTTAKPKQENPLQVKYYDTLKNGFRSFNVARFVGYKSQPLPF